MSIILNDNCGLYLLKLFFHEILYSMIFPPFLLERYRAWKAWLPFRFLKMSFCLLNILKENRAEWGSGNSHQKRIDSVHCKVNMRVFGLMEDWTLQRSNAHLRKSIPFFKIVIRSLYQYKIRKLKKNRINAAKEIQFYVTWRSKRSGFTRMGFFSVLLCYLKWMRNVKKIMQSRNF